PGPRSAATTARSICAPIAPAAARGGPIPSPTAPPTMPATPPLRPPAWRCRTTSAADPGPPGPPPAPFHHPGIAGRPPEDNIYDREPGGRRHAPAGAVPAARHAIARSPRGGARRAGGGGGRPAPRDPARRLLQGDLSLVRQGAGPLALPGPEDGAPALRSPGEPQPAPDDQERDLRRAPGHRLRAGHPLLRGGAPARRARHLDHARDDRGLLPPARHGIRSLGGVLPRRRPGRRPVRSVARRGLLRRIDVHARGRRLE